MKYLEEINHGECFLVGNELYLLTADFRSNNQKLCYSLNTGFAHWFNDQEMVESCPLFRLDANNNIIPLK
jgi:hypothetical protein